MTIHHSESIVSLLKAMHKVQGQVDGVAKDATNPHFKRTYASLESVVDTIRQPCQDAGLVVMQAPGEALEGTISVTTMIGHAESGEWLKSTVQLPMAKADPQGAGSAITYAERYSLMALFNLPPVDDDGEAAVRAPQRRAEADPFDAIEAEMISAVNARSTVVALTKMTQSDKFVGDFRHLPDEHQQRVSAAIIAKTTALNQRSAA